MAGISRIPFLVLATGCMLGLLLTGHAALANDLYLGKAAPPATLVTLDGKHITSRDLLGHTVILTFWSSWCENCRAELPLLSQYATAHRDQGLVVLGFCLDDEETLSDARTIASHLDFPVGLLSQSQVPGYGRIWRIPVSFVIDRNGRLRYDGWQDSDPVWTQATLDKVVGPLLTRHQQAAAE